jgi:hypothetical protein
MYVHIYVHRYICRVLQVCEASQAPSPPPRVGIPRGFATPESPHSGAVLRAGLGWCLGCAGRSLRELVELAHCCVSPQATGLLECAAGVCVRRVEVIWHLRRPLPLFVGG